MSAQPAFIHAFCEPHGQTDFLPSCGRFFPRLNQPRCVGHFDIIFIRSPAASVLEARTKQQTGFNQPCVQAVDLFVSTKEVIMFFLAKKTP